MNKIIFPGIFFSFFLFSFYSCQSPPSSQEDSSIHLIFETDMGNDVDDALALDMLYKYMDTGKVKLLAISNNKNSPYSVQFLNIMNHWYGHPDIPLGNVVNGANSEGDSKNYAQLTCEYTVDGKKVFEDILKDSSKADESVHLYRKTLAAQPDSSVVIASVGFSTNIARLLDSKGDDLSPLSGKELVAKKVKLLAMMAGSFNDSLNDGEYNVMKDTNAARKVFEEWPTRIVISPFEVGIQVEYPGASIENDFPWAPNHPLTIAYKSYQPMPYDRPTWDPTAVLYAVEGNDANYFTVTGPGKVMMPGGAKTEFHEEAGGRHFYLSVDKQQAEKIKKHFIEMVTRKPKRYR
jgi:inosine-uridine nucleoside N-ribohydrolase